MVVRLQTLLLRLVLVGLGLAGSGAAESREWTFDQRTLSKEGVLTEFINKVGQGDAVILLDATKQERFELGEEVGNGKFGIVFDLKNSNPARVIKFPRSAPQQIKALATEIKSLKALEKSNVPHVPIIQENQFLFIVKPKITGTTLEEFIVNQWPTLPTSEKISSLRKLADLLKTIDNQSLVMSDLHLGNIMFDTKSDRWVVVDPGHLLRDGTTAKTSTLYLRHELRRIPEAQVALTLIETGSPFLTDYLNHPDPATARRIIADHSLDPESAWRLIYQVLPRTSGPGELVDMVESGKAAISTDDLNELLITLQNQRAKPQQYIKLMSHIRGEKELHLMARKAGEAVTGSADISQVGNQVAALKPSHRDYFDRGLQSKHNYKQLVEILKTVPTSDPTTRDSILRNAAEASSSAAEYLEVFKWSAKSDPEHSAELQKVEKETRDKLNRLKPTSAQRRDLREALKVRPWFSCLMFSRAA